VFGVIDDRLDDIRSNAEVVAAGDERAPHIR
jgi:hypothetical protein